MAVISLGGIVTSRSIRIASDEMDEAVINHVKRTYNLMIGSGQPNKSKQNRHSIPLPTVEVDEVRGRDLVTGLPKTIEITSKNL